MRRAVAAVLLVLIPSPSVLAHAQAAPKVRRGETVRVLASPAGAVEEVSAVGRVEAVTTDSLVLVRARDRARLAVAVAELRALWVRRGGAARGALKGAAVGAAIGVAGALLPEGEGEVSIGPETAPALGLLGALIGAPIGAARSKARWEPVALPAARAGPAQ